MNAINIQNLNAQQTTYTLDNAKENSRQNNTQWVTSMLLLFFCVLPTCVVETESCFSVVFVVCCEEAETGTIVTSEGNGFAATVR